MPLAPDPAVRAIKVFTNNGNVVNYQWLKQHFGPKQVSLDVYHSLDHGRAVLETVDQLNQYLFSYAPMIESQWTHATKLLAGQLDTFKGRLIDYGCGQGLAGLLLNDHLGEGFLAKITEFVAIEPSEPALRRAVAIYEALAPQAAVTPVNKAFDAVRRGDLPTETTSSVHIFSNVLDIDGYDHVALLRTGLTPGKHTVIAVGHDRANHGYSQGMGRVKDAVDSGTIDNSVSVEVSNITQFTCENRDEPAVLWFCKLEVGHG